MRAAVLALLAGCSFQPGQFVASTPDDAGHDAGSGATDAPRDAALDAAIDAMPDAFVPSATTDHGSVADTFLAANSFANTNFSMQTSALVDGAPDPCVIVMRFDLSSIATTAVVTEAELHIWTDNDDGAATSIYPVLESWTESTATWNERGSNMSWLAAGAAPPSRGATAIGTVNPAQTFTGYVIPITTATVAGWVANPATNHGIAFVTTDPDGTRFSTRDNSNAGVRPFLRVTHAP